MMKDMKAKSKMKMDKKDAKGKSGYAKGGMVKNKAMPKAGMKKMAKGK
jgi:hypothetical protein